MTVQPSFLPPMDAWYSGILPYGVLLPLQVLILVFQAEISRELWSGRGPAAVPRPRLGRVLARVSLLYFLVMFVRFVITHLVLARTGPFGDVIPIVFHWVLAAYVWLLSRWFRGLPMFGEPERSRVS